MTGALSWLNDLLQWLGRWVPRMVLIQPTHRGVRFGPTGKSCEVGPGLIVYWPITHIVINVPVTTQSLQLNAQALPATVKDGEIVPRVLLCAAAVQYRVSNAVRAATRALSLHALVDNRTQAAIARHVSLSEDTTAWSRTVIRELRRELRPFGVVVERMDFTQNGTGVALKNVSDWNYTDRESGTRPD